MSSKHKTSRFAFKGELITGSYTHLCRVCALGDAKFI